MKDDMKEVKQNLSRLHGALSNASILINTKLSMPDSIKEKYLAIIQEIYSDIKLISLQGMDDKTV